MKALRFTLFALLFAGFGYTVQAQNYSSSVGLRLGVPLSVSYKTFLSETLAVEGFVGYRSRKFFGVGWSQINAVALLEIHNDLSSVTEGLQWYYGGGAGVYFASFDDGFNFDGNDDSNLGIGISGVLGAEYTFADTPVTIAADWLPTFLINGFGSGFTAGYGALSVRYVLGR